MTAMELEKPAAIHHSPEQSAHEAAERIMAAICGQGVAPEPYQLMPDEAIGFEADDMLVGGFPPGAVYRGMRQAVQRYQESTGASLQITFRETF